MKSLFNGLTHDHLGFEFSESFNYDAYEQSQAQYLSVLARRSKRWDGVMPNKGYKHKSAKMQRFVRKGIPHQHRSTVWMHVTGAEAAMKKNVGLYERLKAETRKSSEVADIIDIDMPRTFPDNIHFNTTESDSLDKPLKNILICFAKFNPDIGYCQGLNYVGALMLLVLRNEEKTFWLLHTVVGHLCQDYYANKPFSMIGLQTDLKVLQHLLKLKSPEVEVMLRVQKVDLALVCTKWFICLYIDILPYETVLRIWDAFFMEGSHILIRVALLLIRRGEVNLQSCTEFHRVIETFKEITEQNYTFYCHNFMEAVFDSNEDITPDLISSLRDRYRKEVKNELYGQTYKLTT